MTVAIERITTPTPDTDYRQESPHRRAGVAIAAIGLIIAMVVAAIGIVAGINVGNGTDANSVGQTLAVAFGLNTLALATTKIGISVVLIGILIRLWLRMDAVTEALPGLGAKAGEHAPKTSPYGPVTVTNREPSEMKIHKMAKTLWAPMLAMGYMLVIAGLVTSWVWAANIGTDAELAVGASAWTQGLQFLGEAMVLAGISFLLGSILRGLRQGGGQVQERLGFPVVTLDMPASAKAFIALMALGMMIAIAQFIGYIIVTTFDDPIRVATWFAFLGPLRELGLASLLSGIVLALATIGRVIGFQFWRLRSLVTAGL